jgi:alcohol dehydrogenase class IV
MHYALRILAHRLRMQFYRQLGKLMPQQRPMLFVGSGSSLHLCNLIPSYGVKRLLVVTDAELVSLGLVRPVLERLEQLGLSVTVYDRIEPNPSVDQIQRGIDAARACAADAVLAVGGGSPMDAAKIIAAGVTNPMTIPAMEGVLKIKRKPLPIFAVPTTAGTGSEVTMAAVVSDPLRRRKFAVGDPKLIPRAAALDAQLMLGLPPAVTAATGIDALTHAVEAFISTLASETVRVNARLAVRLVFQHLLRTYRQGGDVLAREGMAVASYHAGVGISDAGLGYVHAIAHQLGGMYRVPHGLANAVVLPYVLDYSLPRVTPQLAELAALIDVAQAGDTPLANAQRFIDAVRALLADVGIPSTLPVVQTRDVPLIVERALAEAFQFYGVPHYLPPAEATRLLGLIRGAA